MQRLHETDLTGYLLESDASFKHIRIPAIAETDESWRVTDRIRDKERIIKRKQGEPLHLERENLAKLLEAKNAMGEYDFAGQYQQTPAPREGGIIKKSWLKFYNKQALFNAIQKGEVRVKSIAQSWDTANKIEKHNDYSACVTLLLTDDGKIYVLDIYREKLEFPNLIRKIIQRYISAREMYQHKIDLFIEDQASGTSIIQELTKNHKIYPKGIKPEHDKETRLMAVSNLIENGSCLFPDDNPHWWFEFEQELLRFPKAKHDDQCDALSQALANLPEKTQIEEWIDFYKSQEEK